jgi:exonuclease V
MLTIHGRKKATKAMKAGTVVHQKLEDQVFTTVVVSTATREDAWGLKIWNTIQGLRTLESIGYTRELQVWGTIGGQLVNGIIDEVSFTCPDTELEAETEQMEKSSKYEPPADQMTISDFFKASDGKSIADATRSKRRALSHKAYICDVKTRSISMLPKGAAFRPTKMQLMLYHHLLSNLATNQVDISLLLDRFKLDGNLPFSDAFVAQISSLNDGDVFNSASEGGSVSSSQDSMTVLLENNSLSALWALMISHFQRVLPYGKDSIGKILKAEYRTRDTGDVLGSTTFPMDETLLGLYLDREMQWWKGQREAVGVVIEEAYKCKSCEYAEICEWRLARVDEATETSRRRKRELKSIKKSEI